MLTEAQIRGAIDWMVEARRTLEPAAAQDQGAYRAYYTLRHVLLALAEAGMVGAQEHLDAEVKALRASREAERVRHAVPNNRAGRRMLKRKGRG